MEPFIGQIIMFAGTFAPRGWAFCNGQLLDISSNSALFSILGTSYGGDGRTTFGLPDLRGRFAMHVGGFSGVSGPGLSPRNLGQSGGTETNILSINQLPPHNHQVALPVKEEGDTDNPVGTSIAGDGTNAFGTTSDGNLGATATGNTGGGQSVNNIPPFQTVNYIIALVGLFPSRS